MCETFAQKEMFCWTCHVIAEVPNPIHSKCLGHLVGGSDAMKPKDIQYADTTYGAVKVNSESIFISIKKKIRDLAGPEASDGSGLTVGLHAAQYFQCPETCRPLCEWIQAFLLGPQQGTHDRI